MSAFDDEIFSEFVVECREHLETIESDLLAIEDPSTPDRGDLINKVFRAAHTIKGGAGFLGLGKIQELAHAAENVLDRVRSNDIEPQPDVVNILLQSFDQLSALIEDYQNSQSADVSELTHALTDLLSSHLESDERETLKESVEVKTEDADYGIQVNKYDLSRTAREGYFIYLVRIDLIHDLENQGKRPWDLIQEITSAGTILASQIDVAAIGSLEGPPSAIMPLEILYSTILNPEFVDGVFEGVPQDRIHFISGPDNPEIILPVPERENPPVDTPEPESEPTPQATTPSPEPEPEPTPPAAPAPQVPEEPLPKVTPVSEPSFLDTPEEEKAPVVKSDAGTAKIDETLRISVPLLDSLMNLAGELVLSRNQLLEAIRNDNKHLVESSSQQIDQISSELQEAIMKTRMQPVGNALNKFPRLVRDLSRKSGKSIDLEIVGKDVEMDKAIVEGIGDPLTHMIRNSADHGIESPEDRIHSGKPETGTIRLEARYEAGQVVIEVKDDGKGMDPARIASSAIRDGKVTEEEVARMSDREKLNLIFLPGFSTAAEITEVSGRGVGMDVVKTNIDKLGGLIELDSKIGSGSRIRINLPLTLAIMPTLLVANGEQMIAVPQANLRELISFPKEERDQHVKRVDRFEVITVRDEVIPVVHLSEVTGSAQSEVQDENYNLMILRSGTSTFGIFVDALHDTEEIVVRPLGIHLKKCIEYAGSTILGNGRVAMILDPGGVAEKTGLSSGQFQESNAETEATDVADDTLQTILFSHNDDESCAIPVHRIRRIEKIAEAQVEDLAGLTAMQYRDGQLPLLRLDEHLPLQPLEKKEDLIVLVIEKTDKSMVGLLARQPVDIGFLNGQIDDHHSGPGVIGSCVVDGKTTLILDAEHFSRDRREVPQLTGPESTAQPLLDAGHDDNPFDSGEDTQASEPIRILLAEDSDFFRKQLTGFLQSANYIVETGSDGQEAYEIFQDRGESFDLVLTDIEMPRMDGREFAASVRKLKTGQDVPIVALSTLADEADIQKALDAGVTEYHIKLDRETLLDAVRRLVPGA